MFNTLKTHFNPLLLTLIFLSSLTSWAQQSKEEARAQWVDSTYQSLTDVQKIGQLFVVMIQSKAPEKELKVFEEELKRHQPGGVIFSLGTPYKQAQLTNHYQSLSKVPLMISMDAEWGIAMRLDSVPQYPWNMTLGAIQDLNLLRTIGNHMGMQAKRMGVHMNFAPVADVNINPNNPIIGNRSFGSDVKRVSTSALALSQGINEAGVFTCAKHFPGHGDTSVDSHKALPVLPFTRERLDSIELYPYKTPLLQGVQGVMVAHLDVPVLTGEPGLPVSLSQKVTTDLLQKELKFKGLVFTDALNMKGASDFSPDGDVSLKALLAGNDVLVIPNDLGLSIAHLSDALKKGVLTEARLAHSVKKILGAKYDLGLDQYAPVPLNGLTKALNQPIYKQTIEKAYAQAATYVSQTDATPIVLKPSDKVAFVALGEASPRVFKEALKSYGAQAVVVSDLKNGVQALKAFDYVVVGHHRSMETAYKAHRFSSEEVSLLKAINALSNTTILAVFTKPYAVLDLPFIEDIPQLFFGYQNAIQMQQYAAQVLYGQKPAKGVLPVSLKGVK
jgi:beta-glucosidase-like glycosyl hydrolase